ncbi:MAG TPA: hypothetical protein V6D05_04465 [Stenomitos sp.]
MIAGYVVYKGVERSGVKLPFGPGGGRGRALPARKPPAPEKLGFERLTLDATPANLQRFIRLTGNLERLGFRIVADYAITGWPDLYCRGLVHQDKPVHAVIVERLGSPTHVELFTLFDDLSAMVTSGSEEAEDPGKPAALRFQQLPGLTLDELFVQHLSSLETLYQDQLTPMPATRLAFFEHQRALLVIEHELRKAKRALRTEHLSRTLDALPELPTRELLKRYGLEDPVADAPDPLPAVSKAIPIMPRAEAEPEEAPKRWGVGSSLLSKRLAAREEADTPEEAIAESNQTLVLDPEPDPGATSEPDEAVVLELTVEAVAPTFDLERDEPEEPVPSDFTTARSEAEAPEATVRLPFEVIPEPPEPIRLPFEVVPDSPPLDTSEAAEPGEPLPFEVSAETAPTTGSKPTCPHCGATLFSSLSSRCSKCKQAVR